ncbi:MAG: hypothetical protein ACODAA_02565, partial [Gemmatimonadota bacterium]
LLRLFVPASHREYVAGDLLEELRAGKREQLGSRGARHWYVGQAARSAWPFLLLRLRRGELVAELAIAQLFVIGVLLALDAFGELVLGQVPLRAAAVTPGFEVAGLVVGGSAAGVVGFACAVGADDGARASPLALGVFVALATVVFAPIVGGGHVVSPVVLAAGLGLGALVGARSAPAARGPGPSTTRKGR